MELLIPHDLKKYNTNGDKKEYPRCSGVYFLFDNYNDIVYIGKSNCLRRRVLNHIKNDIIGIYSVSFHEIYDMTNIELHRIEMRYIKKYEPSENVVGTINSNKFRISKPTIFFTDSVFLESNDFLTDQYESLQRCLDRFRY